MVKSHRGRDLLCLARRLMLPSRFDQSDKEGGAGGAPARRSAAGSSIASSMAGAGLSVLVGSTWHHGRLVQPLPDTAGHEDGHEGGHAGTAPPKWRVLFDDGKTRDVCLGSPAAQVRFERLTTYWSEPTVSL